MVHLSAWVHRATTRLAATRDYPWLGRIPVIGHESFGASVGAPYIWYDRGAWVHKQIAKEVYAKLPILDEEQFDEVVWGVVRGALKDAPQMFQISMGKQTSDECMYVAGVNKNLAKYKPR